MIAHRQAVLQGCQGGAVSTSVFLYSFYLRPVNGYLRAIAACDQSERPDCLVGTTVGITQVKQLVMREVRARRAGGEGTDPRRDRRNLLSLVPRRA